MPASIEPLSLRDTLVPAGDRQELQMLAQGLPPHYADVICPRVSDGIEI